MKWQTTCCVGLLSLILIGAGQSEPKATALPTSAAARQAITTHERNVSNVTKVFESSVAKSRDEMTRALTAALDDAMERKDLNEANRIKAYIESSKVREQPVDKHGLRGQCDELARKLAGTSWQYAEGFKGFSGAKINFNRDGSVAFVGKQATTWQWAAIDGRSVLLQYDNSAKDILTFDEALTTYKQTGIMRAADGWGGKRLGP